MSKEGVREGGVVDKGLVQFLVRGEGRISLEREGMRGSCWDGGRGAEAVYHHGPGESQSLWGGNGGDDN